MGMGLVRRLVKFHWIVVAMLAPQAALALDDIDLGDGFTLKPYGYLSPTYLHFDDGVKKYDNLADSNHLNTRLGFYLSHDLGSGKLTFNFESALGFRQTNAITQGDRPDLLDWDRSFLRKVEFIYETDSYGKFSLGQGELAAFGVSSQQDLSGTILANYGSLTDTAGLFRFRTTDGTLTDVTLFAGYQTYDGGRFGRFRYDSPEFNNITISSSIGTDILTPETDDLLYDLTARYANKIGAYQIMGAVGVLRIEPAKGDNTTNSLGGLAVLHDSGVNFEVGGGNSSAGGTFGYTKLGYIANWLPVGSTAMAIDYYYGSDVAYDGADTDTLGLGLVQTFKEQNLFAFLEYRTYKLTDNTPTKYKRAQSFMAGITFQF